MENFLIVAGQVVILFILIAIGFVLGKLKIMTEEGARVCSNVVLLVVTPCAIINSFRREATLDVLMGLLTAFGVSVLVHLLAIAAAHLLFGKNDATSRVFRLSTVLSNAGFMAFPLQRAVLGEIGVFYGAAYVVVFNLVLWSYGQLTMDRSGNKLNVRKLLLNPGTVALVLGLLVLFLPFDLPKVVAGPIEHLAALNTPVPMLFIGYSLSKVNFKKAFTRPGGYAVCAVRLILVPVLAAAAMYLIGLRGTLLTAMTIAASAPVAAAVAMFASRYDQDEESAVNAVAMSTLLSIITMPIIVSVVQSIGG